MFYIFDWDGTISDSAEKITQCMQAAASQVGLDALDDDTIRNIIGLGLPEAINTLYPHITPEKNAECRKAYSTHFTEQDQVPSPFFPDVMETLTQLRDRNCILAVATGKSRRGLARVLKNLNMENFFHHSRCADETASKPNPLMLKELMEEANMPVSESVMIGDTEWDMVMADNIGMRKIAVSYGAHTPERLKQLQPDLFINRFEDILEWQF